MKTNEKKEDKVYFSIIISSTGDHLFGKILESCFSSWVLCKSKLIVSDPIKLMVTPIQQGNKLIYKFMLMPIYPTMTKQQKVAVDASLVEILEEVIHDDTGNFYCKEYEKLFSLYLNSIQQHRAEMAGIIMPSDDEIVATTSMSTEKTRKILN